MHNPESETKTILIVDDDQALGEMLSIVLESEGFRTTVCADGLRALDVLPVVRPDLVLLDVMLPGMGGVEVARMIRRDSGVPIIMLTAKSDTQDIVTGLEAGADDYVPKPFKVAELVARVRARLRIPTPTNEIHFGGRGNDSGHIECGGIVMDRGEHLAQNDGADLQLTPMEFELLYVLACNAGEVISRANLLKSVWGYEDAGDTRLVTVHIQRLRAKVESNPEHPQIIRTVRGIGYKFVAPVAGCAA